MSAVADTIDRTLQEAPLPFSSSIGYRGFIMLEAPYHHCLSAAEGWLQLGQAAEARAEMEKIPARFAEDPGVLEVWWEIWAAERKWDEAWRVGEKRVGLFPNDPANWIQRAFAARRAIGGGLSKAWAALRPAFERFPGEAIIPYNLACYAAQMGDLDEAWTWLSRAMERAGDRRTMKQMALNDEDLRPLWEKLKGQPL